MRSAKHLFLIAIASVLLFGSGCSICSNCDLDAYSAYGGRWQRTERSEGRVGSLFHPAGALVPYGPSGVDPNSVLESPETNSSKAAEDDSAAGDSLENEEGGIDLDFGTGIQETSVRGVPNY